MTASPGIQAEPQAVGMTTQVVRGSLWSLGGQGVVIATSLVATPFVIRLLGTESYGVLALINALIGYLAFADLGMGAASTRFGSQAHARGDDEEEASVVWTALALSFIPSMVAALALALAARPLVEHALRLPDHLQGVAVIALRIAAIGFVARAVSGVLNTPQLTRLRMDLYTMINSGSAVAQLALVPVALASGGGLVGGVTVMAGVAVVMVLLHAYVFSRFLPGLMKPRISSALIANLLSFGSPVVVSTLAGMLLVNAEKILLTRYASLTSLAYYSVAFAVAGLLAVVPSALGQSLLPAFSRLQAQSDRAPLQILYSRVLRANLLWIPPVTVILCVGARPFFSFWAGPEYGRESSLPFYILIFGLMFNIMAYIPAHLLISMGRTAQVARFHLAEVLPYILCVGVLTYKFGAVGAAMAWSLRVIIDAMLMFSAARRASGFSFSTFQKGRAWYVALILVLLLPVGSLIIRVDITVQICAVFVSVAAYTWVVWTRVLTYDERTWLFYILNENMRWLISGKG
jgi:O-antigen/teichoic acid export membrane protein